VNFSATLPPKANITINSIAVTKESEGALLKSVKLPMNSAISKEKKPTKAINLLEEIVLFEDNNLEKNFFISFVLN
jgi:hypothetical protein